MRGATKDWDDKRKPHDGPRWRVVTGLMALLAALQVVQITYISGISTIVRSAEARWPAISSVNASSSSALGQVCPEVKQVPCDCPEGKAWVPKTYDSCLIQIVGGRAKDQYGSWPLCINQVPPRSIVYSVGIGLDVSFDIEMIKRGHRVYAFDPTILPQSIPGLFGPNNSPLMRDFHFMQVGLGSGNGVTTFLKSRQKGIQSMTALGLGSTVSQYDDVGFQAAVLTLPTLMAVHGHDHVDLLKVDVEGIEFGLCETQGFLDALDRVGQVIYEFHERLLKDPGTRKFDCIAQLEKKGFTMVNSTLTEEYVFARMAPGGPVTLASTKA